MLQNKRLLFIIIGALITLRFLWLPWYQYSQQQHQQLETLSKRVYRSEQLLLQRDTLQLSQQLQQKQLLLLLEKYPEVSSVSQYHLQLQKQLQQLAASQQVSISFFDWLSDTPLGIFNMQRGRVSVRLQGNIVNIMQLHATLENLFPHFITRDLRGSWRSELTPQSDIELTLLIEVDYRVQNELQVKLQHYEADNAEGNVPKSFQYSLQASLHDLLHQRGQQQL